MSVTKAVGHTTVAGLSDPPVNATHTHSPAAQHTTPSIYSFFFWVDEMCVGSPAQQQPKRDSSLFLADAAPLYYIFFFFFQFLFSSIFFCMDMITNELLCRCLAQPPTAQWRERDCGRRTPSVMFLARGSTPNILYTSFFFSFLFFLQLERERDIFLQAVLAITSRSPSQKRIHHPTITPADDDDQQLSQRGSSISSI